MRRVAFDSIPKLRRVVLGVMATHRVAMSTTEITIQVKHPKTTVLRTLEDLHAHGVIDRLRVKQGVTDSWRLSEKSMDWLRVAQVIVEDEA